MQRALVTRDKTLIRKSIGNCFDTAGKTGDAQWGQFCLLTMVVVDEMDDAFRFAEVGYSDTQRLYRIDDDRWLTAPPYNLDTTQLFSPRMAPFRNDPRFWPLALRTGLINYWQTTQQWPDFCRGQLGVCKARAAEAVRDSAMARA